MRKKQRPQSNLHGDISKLVAALSPQTSLCLLKLQRYLTVFPCLDRNLACLLSKVLFLRTTKPTYFPFLAFGAQGFAAHGFLAAHGFFTAHGLAAQGLPAGADEAR